MVRLKTSCCGLSIYTGAQIIMWIFFVLSTYLLIMTIHNSANNRKAGESPPYVSMVVAIISLVLIMLFSLSGIYGVSAKNAHFLFCFYIFNWILVFIMIFAALAMLVIIITALVNGEPSVSVNYVEINHTHLIGIAIGTLVCVGLQLYMAMIIKSCYDTLLEGHNYDSQKLKISNTIPQKDSSSPIQNN